MSQLISKWTSSQYTDTGKVRNINEDSLIVNDQHFLWAVADGMGGHENGDYASQYVTDILSQYRNADTIGSAIARIDRCLAHCNTHLVEKAAAEQRDIIGCTLALLYIHDQQAYCVWSGDSRIYRLRNSQLLQMTRDHNYECLTLDRDLIANPNAMAGDEQMLTCAIGGDIELQIEHCHYSTQENDQYFLCTDGLYKEISEQELCDTLNQFEPGEAAVNALAQLYQERGARDNVGMVHIFTESCTA